MNFNGRSLMGKYAFIGDWEFKVLTELTKSMYAGRSLRSTCGSTRSGIILPTHVYEFTRTA